MKDIILYIIIVLLLIFLQISFFTALPNPYYNIKLILPFLVFLVWLVDYAKALKVGIALGLLLELYSSYTFGLVAISIIFTLVLINFLFSNLFTNRSIYSLASLTIVGIFSFNIIMIIFTNLIYFFISTVNRIDLSQLLLLNYVWQAVFGIIFISILYFGYILTKKINRKITLA